MKAFLNKFLAVNLALLVLGSTVSFSVDMHFCGDKLVDYSFFDDSADCGMKMLIPEGEPCPMKAIMDCCTDQEFNQDGQDELAVSFNTMELPDQQVHGVLILAWTPDTFKLPQQNLPFEHYDPPWITYDITVRYETFLI